MSYTIHQTEGFILSSVNVGEANKIYKILTEKFGLVSAKAQGVRLQKSKLRFALQNFSYGSFSLVRGKEYWKLVSAVSENNIFSKFNRDDAKLKICSNIFLLLRRLLAGEEKNFALYKSVEDGYFYLSNNNLDNDALKSFEIIIVLRILTTLGYVGENNWLNDFTANTDWNNEVISRMGDLQRDATSVINKSLSQSHL